MTRYLFGAGGDGEINSATTGLPYASTVANIYNARTGGSAVTDLQNLAGSSVTQVTSDTYGQFAFFGPDNYKDTLWLDLGTGPRWAMRPVDINGLVNSVAATQAANQITTTRSNDFANRVFTTKASLPKNTSDPLESALADTLDNKVYNRFASSGARDAAFPSPAAGDLIYRTDIDQFQYYHGSMGGWNNLNQGYWIAYTPSWTAATTNPVLGNGSITGRYVLIGRTVTVTVQLTAGSTTTFGSGNYFISLPFTTPNNGVSFLGSSRLIAANTWHGIANVLNNDIRVQPVFSAGSGDTRSVNWSPTAPETFANGHIMRFTATFEAL